MTSTRDSLSAASSRSDPSERGSTATSAARSIAITTYRARPAFLRIHPARHMSNVLSRPPVFLGPRRREAVRLAVVETCVLRGWILHALNVRTNHVHLVATTDVLARTVLSTMKARATAQMRRLECWNSNRSPWAKGGSARAIWTAEGLGRAVEYVLHGQGPDLD